MKTLTVYTTGRSDHYKAGTGWEEYAEQSNGSLLVTLPDGTSVRYAPGYWTKVVTEKAGRA